MERRLKEWIENALSDFFNSVDRSLIDRKLKEECINHRLACHIEWNKPEQYLDYYIDIEYNKNGINEKTLGIDGDIKPIRPDIIVHKRTNDTDNNLLAIECKIGYLNKNDKRKLRGLLSTGFFYKEAIGLSYQKGKDYCLIYLKENDFGRPRKISKERCLLE